MQVGFRKGLCATKKERGWTQEILAHRLGVGVASVRTFLKRSEEPTVPYSLKIRFVSGHAFSAIPKRSEGSLFP